VRVLHVIATSLVALAPLFPLAVNAQSLPAWSFTRRTTIDSAKGQPGVSITSRQQVTNRFVRTETLRRSGVSDQLASIDGAFTLFDRNDSSTTIVSPATKTAIVMPTGTGGNIARATRVRYRPGSTRRIRDLGPGERLLGHSTERYQVTVSGMADMTILGATCQRSVDETYDLWIAPDVDIAPALRAPSRVGELTDDVATLDGGLGLPPDLAIPTGTPLRVVAHRNSPKGARPRAVTTTLEFLELSHGPVSAARFALPPGYATKDDRASLAGRIRLVDSLVNTESINAVRRMCDDGR
jgi:hypothetical protein